MGFECLTLNELLSLTLGELNTLSILCEDTESSSGRVRYLYVMEQHTE